MFRPRTFSTISLLNSILYGKPTNGQRSNVFPSELLSTRLIACCVVFLSAETNLYCFRHAFNGSFTTRFFIGRVNDEDPGEFVVRPNGVGFPGIFTTTAEAVYANFDEQRALDFMYEDAVPITSTLVDYLDNNPISNDLIKEGTIRTIPNLEPANVEPFLKEHLKWRIVDTVSNLMNSEQQIKDSY